MVDAVAGRIPVFVDGGFRRGSDVVKALAAGATAVFVGRAAVWGMACDGEAGARGVLAGLVDDIARTLVLLGADRVDEVAPHHLLANLPFPGSAGLSHAGARHG